MKRVLVLAAICAAMAAAASAADKAALADEGKALMMQYGGALQTELKAAIQARGPAHAIDVCNLRAPQIAAAVSAESGWSIGRSSHKLRNVQGNAPDAYTAAAIDDFLARQAAGESAETLVRAEIVEEDGQRRFRMVKAIPTAEVCLTCHGAEVAPEVAAELAKYYPEDQARGFTVGEMRGVFTLSKPLD